MTCKPGSNLEERFNADLRCATWIESVGVVWIKLRIATADLMDIREKTSGHGAFKLK